MLEPPELKHFYGPDPEGTGNPNAYRLNWGHVDPFAGRAAAPSRRQERDLRGVALRNRKLEPVGVRRHRREDDPQPRLVPSLDPPVGAVDRVRHPEPPRRDARSRRTATARASGAIGILVESWDLAGGSFNEDADHSVDMWDRIENNPSGGRDYDGTADANALAVEILASGNRRYAIWVYCWAYVESQTGFAVATRASAMISCRMPYLFVEEKKLS